ncbi:MAG: hypothetical protein AAB299_00940 [Thermodesulfobacteriota bacterium]
MLEKLGGTVAMIGSIAAMAGLNMLNLPVFITALLVFVCVMIYLGGIVFLFAEGQILTRDRWGKRPPKVG